MNGPARRSRSVKTSWEWLWNVAVGRVGALGMLIGAWGAGLADARADDWPQWFGPRRDDVWRESGILRTFPAEGPKVLWRVPVQGGYSSPVVVKDRLYLMDRTEGVRVQRKKGERALPTVPGTERIFCVDARSGRTLWEHRYDRPYQVDYPAGPRSTPVVHRGRVYALGAMGDLTCLDANTGRLMWARHFQEDFPGLDVPIWGFACHPLVEGKTLICTVGGEGSAVVAFDLAMGKERWRALTTKEIGYAPPTIVEVKGRRQLICLLSDVLASLNPATGATNWTLPYPVGEKPRRPEVTIAMPREHEGKVFITSFYHGALLLDITGEQPTVVWRRRSTNESELNDGLHTVMCTPVILDGHVYGVCGMGELRCLDWAKGDRVWESYAVTGGKEGLFANAFLTRHEDRYWVWNDQGDLLLAKLSPQGCEVIGQTHLLDTAENSRGRDVVWSHPAYANRCAYVRNGKELVCVSLAAHQPRAAVKP